VSVIAIALCAMALGAGLITLLRLLEPGERCEAVSKHSGLVYNVCILAKSHNGSHTAADGMRF